MSLEENRNMEFPMNFYISSQALTLATVIPCFVKYNDNCSRRKLCSYQSSFHGNYYYVTSYKIFLFFILFSTRSKHDILYFPCTDIFIQTFQSGSNKQNSRDQYLRNCYSHILRVNQVLGFYCGRVILIYFRFVFRHTWASFTYIVEKIP